MVLGDTLGVTSNHIFVPPRYSKGAAVSPHYLVDAHRFYRIT